MIPIYNNYCPNIGGKSNDLDSDSNLIFSHRIEGHVERKKIMLSTKTNVVYNPILEPYKKCKI